MKKITLISLASIALLGLAGCSSLTRAIKGDQYQASKSVASSSSETTQSTDEALQKALKADSSAFPQLSSTVASDEAQVTLHTSKGSISIKLFPKYAPLAVENFLTHAKEGYYNGLTFHRVIADFMIQSGDPNGDGTGGQSIWKGKDSSIDSGNGFKNETTPYLYNLRGALAMANAGTDTNGSQFFINQNKTDQSSKLPDTLFPQAIINAYKQGGNPSLDGGYTVFGQVISGMDVVDAISSVATDSNDKPTSAVTISDITVDKDYSFK
ncbi:peptidylprolyl isomerase [Streptococcus saliviloxodontae]|uniref:Peptidyl-prolyl cis-trans isomerase n=1 Tax=Streptococcus saliviloxodontae TaxID=1349416 RepID=A0ABS2PKH2_9STRE|nr:peptidylprolyl isomerase [Streptococcus saliviloxodontae]MBM7635792.1 peptidyl-prolyl cis-trans isomerase A (cyclophilin A) [Streptococcus saliviloxodontae]